MARAAISSCVKCSAWYCLEMTPRDWLSWKNMSIPDLAKLISVSRKTAYRIVGGEHLPRAATLRRLEKATAGMVTANDIMGNLR